MNLERLVIKYADPSLVLRKIRRWVIIGVGLTVLFIGIALLVLPGPAILVIPLGLAILAGELVWARTFLQKIRRTLGLEKKEHPAQVNGKNENGKNA